MVSRHPWIPEIHHSGGWQFPQFPEFPEFPDTHRFGGKLEFFKVSRHPSFWRMFSMVSRHPWVSRHPSFWRMAVSTVSRVSRHPSFWRKARVLQGVSRHPSFWRMVSRWFPDIHHSGGWFPWFPDTHGFPDIHHSGGWQFPDTHHSGGKLEFFKAVSRHPSFWRKARVLQGTARHGLFLSGT